MKVLINEAQLNTSYSTEYAPDSNGFLKGHGLVVTLLFVVATLLSLAVSGVMMAGLVVAGSISVFFQVRDKGDHSIRFGDNEISGMMGELGDSNERGRLSLSLKEIDIDRSYRRSWLDKLCFSYRIHNRQGRSVVVSGTLFGLDQAPKIHQEILTAIRQWQIDNGGISAFIA
ncbi:hypothetical protein [Ferrimonas sp. SCSIO 43195]|uniref:hypothetical protein n=1 Tax=Ferrimonas sp. SCSIO 43195 TaxID=2822844 RepID=UPI0020755C1B|nr:hypothetical protein [Ferrimonas sp. SCSIO 43195]USD39104.1 hypothetical protein J8Z22_08400 [Ferrimonas sp. SCSIO 43195]